MAPIPGRIGRVLRTLPHIKPKQALAQLEHMLRGLRPPRPWDGPVPDLAVTAAPTRYPAAPAHARLDPGATLSLLNQQLDVSSGIDWSYRAGGPLFAYHLHQHDYLRPGALTESAETPRVRAACLLDWVARHEQGTGWDPHPICVRAFTWARFLTTPGALELDDAEAEVLRRSLAMQIDCLDRNIETRLQANHLLSNLMGIVLGGLLLDGPRTEAWRARSVWLEQELARQVHPDGAHEERSPMYHALLLENLLDLINVSLASEHPLPERIAGGLHDTAARMLGAIDVWTHRDGDIALFADSAFDIAQPPAELHRYAAALGIAPSPPARAGVLDDGGYVRLDTGDWTLIASVDGPRPAHQPGHAHCDALAFELTFGAERVVTDTGVYEYVPGARRHTARATHSHATLEIAGAEQAEIWAPHRIGGRPKVELRSVEPGHGFEASCASWSTPGRLHVRRVEMSADAVSVIDRVESKGEGAAVRSSWPIAPEVEVDLDEAAATAVLQLASGNRLRLSLPQALAWRIEDGAYYPEFGKDVTRKVLVGEGRAAGALVSRLAVEAAG